MHNEAGDSVRLAATMILIAYVLFIVTTLVLIGKVWLGDVSNEIDNAVIEAEEQELYNLSKVAETGKKMTVANAYIVLRRNLDKVDVVSGTIDGQRINSVFDLEGLLKHEVFIDVTVNRNGLLEVKFREN